MTKKDRERTSKREKKSEKEDFVVKRIEQRWQAEDDLKLKIAIEQLHDLELVHSAVTFSCYFTLSEIEERWRNLLTGKNVAAAASSEISALSLSAFKKAVKESCLFSDKENEIIIEEIGAIKDPSLGFFARFLNLNAARFHSCRTPAALYEQWKLLYKYRLHNDQTLPHPSMSLQHQDVLTLDLDLNEIDYETHHRLRQQRAEMQKMHEILNTMEMIQKYKEEEKEKVKSTENGHKSPCVCPPPAAENGRRRPCACRPTASAVSADEAPDTLPAIPQNPPDKIKKYCAHIYGDFTSFYFSDELDQITIGRGDVDVDLTKEIGSSRVNRRQCLISKSVEKSKNVFLLRNCGDRPVIVDGYQIGPNATSWLSYNSLIQVQAVNLIFRRLDY